MKPTVGRIVHFYRTGSFKVGPLAAIVTAVIDDRTVNLQVFSVDGCGVQGVEHVTDKADDKPMRADGAYWCWPPRE